MSEVDLKQLLETAIDCRAVRQADVDAVVAELRDLRLLRERFENSALCYAVMSGSGRVASVRYIRSAAIAEAIAEYNDSSRVKAVRLVPVEETNE